MDIETPKMMKVSPNVTDPSMKAPDVSESETMLKEMGGNTSEDDDLHKTILDSKKKTKEEQSAAPETSINKMLILVFALIVIALIALVVWMVMKQNESQRQEEEMAKARMQPHRRNNMPYSADHAQHNPNMHPNPGAYKQSKAHVEEIVEESHDDKVVNRVVQQANDSSQPGAADYDKPKDGADLVANMQADIDANTNTNNDQQVDESIVTESDKQMLSMFIEETNEQAKEVPLNISD